MSKGAELQAPPTGAGLPSVQSMRIYWTYYFARVAPTILHGLGTCGGTFAMEQREYTAILMDPMFPPLRKDVYRSVAALMDRLCAAPMRTLHFGGIFPAHQFPAAPKGPRDFDRTQVCRSGVGTLMGEFVLDVDLDCRVPDKPEDRIKYYDRTGVCRCGRARTVCDRCWSVFLWPAQTIVLRLLRELLGFKAMFCVYSGRRGFHVWVVDRRACTATSAQRRAWVSALQRAWRDLAWIKDMLEPLFDGQPALVRRYDTLAPEPGMPACVDALYPKLDTDVSVDTSHMHKAPLVPHPETGVLCVVMAEPGTKFAFLPSTHKVRVDPKFPDEEEQLTRALVISEILIQMELNKARFT